MDIKQCTKCELILTLAEFPIHKGSKDGTRNMCVKCNKSYAKNYYKKNKDSILQKTKAYRNANKEIIQQKDKERKRLLKNDPKKYADHKKKYNKWYNNRLKTDPSFKLRIYMRNRIKSALKNDSAIKSDKTMSLLGCDLSTLKKHISDKFEKNMEWSNFGKWHVDHIIPLAAFDLEETEHQKVAFHYTNLQPLWAEDNLKKADAVPNNFNLETYVKTTIKRLYEK
tara:strand:- start:9840 stop:10514 length:675 start_codon:yes stop_codon:yes gene_type:complete